MRDQLLSMLILQNEMNRKVHDDWIQQNFEWYRAVWLECGELIDHHGYKWWKHQETQMEQVRLEVVDIWHFGLSMMFDGRTIEEIADDMIEEIKDQEVGAMTVLEAAEELAGRVLTRRTFSLQHFWQLMFAVNMDFDDLYRSYIGKNVLNFFRQDNGYKEGTYIKEWQGREDNEHLSEILKELDPTEKGFQDQVYDALGVRYDIVKKYIS
ncbi:MAG: dUTP diphosphatase [Pseudomonadota bacterium]